MCKIIVAVYNANGTRLASYSYDVWGVCTTTYANGGASTSATKNNLRYRGYYLDSDLGLYYLQSRYYDPNTCRFISPDSISCLGANGGIVSYNLYTYCSSNPVNYVDPSGRWLETVFDLLSLGVSIVEVVLNPLDPLAWAGLAGDAFDLIPFVTGVGESVKGVRVVAKGIDFMDDTYDTIKIMRAVDFTDDTWEIVRSLDRTGGYTQSTRFLGVRIHKGYKFGLPGKEYGGFSGIRLDYFDADAVYELKPYNINSLKAGVKQLFRYRKTIGKRHIWVLQLY